jgi:mannobiose 2-epimerase
MVGFYNVYQLTKYMSYLNKTLANWKLTKANIIDKVNGEWHWSVIYSGIVDVDIDKAEFWKCPCHNSRMCLELLERIAI